MITYTNESYPGLQYVFTENCHGVVTAKHIGKENDTSLTMTTEQYQAFKKSIETLNWKEQK